MGRRCWFSWLLILLIGSIPVFAAEAQPAPEEVLGIIVYGQDLTDEERILIFRELPLPENIKSSELKTLEVSNEEVWRLFKDILPETEIGNESVTAAYLEQLDKDQGLQIEQNNYTEITPKMLANALVTVGVKDLNIYGTAAEKISGVVGLTGILKGVQALTKAGLPEETQRIAARELVLTAKLGDRIGRERAATFVERAKENLFEVDQTVATIIDEVDKAQNVKLNDSERQEFINLFEIVKGLKLDARQLKTQLKNFQPEPEETDKTAEKDSESWLDRVIAFFRSLVDSFMSYAGRIFGFVNGELK